MPEGLSRSFLYSYLTSLSYSLSPLLSSYFMVCVIAVFIIFFVLFYYSLPPLFFLYDLFCFCFLCFLSPTRYFVLFLYHGMCYCNPYYVFCHVLLFHVTLIYSESEQKNHFVQLYIIIFTIVSLMHSPHHHLLPHSFPIHL